MLSRGVSSPLDSELEHLMKSSWHPLSDLDLEVSKMDIPKAIAVDGSMAKRFLAVGCVLYVARSLAICGKRKFRRLEFDSFSSRANAVDVARYISRRSEWLEHDVAREAVEAENDVRFLFLDGSFHGRLMAVPRDLPYEGKKGFIINYFRDYAMLLDACRTRNIIPVGVSKDSRATLLRDHFLSVMLREELRRLDLSPEDAESITETFQRILCRRRGQRVRQFKLLESTYGTGKLDRVLQILLEAKTLRSDHQMILNFTDSAGYSSPLELGAYGRGSELISRYESEPDGYVRKFFPEAIDEAEDPEKFIEDATQVLSEIPSFPTIVSFHVRLDVRDTPIRIDVPSWCFGIDRSLKDLKGFSSITEVDLNNILNMLRLLFGGIRCYNVLLTSVDSEVRLKRETVDRIYFPLLEKNLEFQLPLTHVRGYRRGWYAR
jgi:hypothetical protein